MVKYATERGGTLSICTMGSLRGSEKNIVTPGWIQFVSSRRFQQILWALYYGNAMNCESSVITRLLLMNAGFFDSHTTLMNHRISFLLMDS